MAVERVANAVGFVCREDWGIVWTRRVANVILTWSVTDPSVGYVGFCCDSFSCPSFDSYSYSYSCFYVVLGGHVLMMVLP